MKATLKNIIKIVAIASGAVCSITPIFTHAAYAQPAGTDANYVGAGVSAGVTNGGQNGDAATFGGNIQGRYAVPTVPLSVRGAVLFSGETAAIMPIVTYDVPVTNNANVYVGGGYSFVESNGKPTPIGNQDAPVVTAGVEAEVARNLVLYSDAKLGIKAYQDSPASAVSVQFGAGYRF